MNRNDPPHEPYMALSAIYDSFAHHDYRRWAAFLLRRLRAQGIPPGASLLDVACGTGAITVPLQQAGYNMTGCDISPGMLTQAADRAARAGLHIPLLQQDMRALALHRPCDGVICTCDGVNYLTTRKDLHAFFKSARRCLKPGAPLLFDISSRARLQALHGQLYAQEQEHAAYIWLNTMRAGILEMDLTLFRRRGDGLYTHERELHRQRAWDQPDIERALQACGYVDIRCREAFTGKAPAPTTQRLQFEARTIR